ncbi:MAG: hypothetical protein R3B95_11585 [Nitrospirales bacterium]|nr:hypothetical protein [Nitrospirales bacterium]
MSECRTCGKRIHEERTIEPILVRGHVTIHVLDGKTWDILDQIEQHNDIVASGRSYLGKILKGSIVPPTHVGVGTSDTATTDSDLLLAAEVFRDTISNRIDITDGVRIRFFLPTTAANGETLREAGLFSPNPNARLFSRVTYAAIPKSLSVAVNFSWDITFSQSA